jgi:hypothetical protein
VKCAVKECGEAVDHDHGSTRGWCPSHSARWYRHGDVQAWKPIRRQGDFFFVPDGPLRAYLKRVGASLNSLGEAHAQALRRAAHRGGLTLWTADAIACSLGKHPMEIWDDWWELMDVRGPAPKPRRSGLRRDCSTDGCFRQPSQSGYCAEHKGSA